MPEPLKFSESKLIVLKGGFVVNHDTYSKADIVIEGAVIRDVGLDLPVPDGAYVIDVSDKYVMPGGVDLDCHLGKASLEDPLSDSFESGSKAAVLGGTTTLVNTVDVSSGMTLSDSFDQFVQLSSGQLFCDYAICMRIPRFDDEISTDMERLVKEKGVSLFSLRLGSSKLLSDHPASGILDEVKFCQVLRKCRQLGALPVVPASSSPELAKQISVDIIKTYPDIGPELHQYCHLERAEADTIRKAALHAFELDSVCPLLISRIQSDLALQCFAEQRRYCRGLLFGQTTVSAIAAPISAMNKHSEDQSEDIDLITSKDWTIAAGCVCEPPIRPDVQFSEKLIVHLNSSEMLTVGSGHRAVRTDIKASFGLKRSDAIPKAVAALGCRLVALWNCTVENNGGIDPCSFVRAVSTDPSRLANLYPQKGRIAVGSDADIVVWSKPDTLTNECWDELIPEGVYNVFSGLSPRSRPEVVLLRGRVLVMNGSFVEGIDVHGKLLTVKPFGQMAFSRATAIDQCLHARMEKIIREPYTGPVTGSDPKGIPEGTKEHHYFRKEYYDNMPKVALPPGQRPVHTSVKTVQPPGGSSNAFWLNN